MSPSNFWSDIHRYIGILTSGGDSHRDRCPSLGMSPWSLCVGHCDSPLSQSIGTIPASQDALVDVLIRIEHAFHLLEVHIEVPPTSVMVETTSGRCHVHFFCAFCTFSCFLGEN